MKVILAVMNPTYLCSKGNNNFFRPYLHLVYCISGVHYCEDCFHVFHETTVHIYELHIVKFIVITSTGLKSTAQVSQRSWAGFDTYLHLHY